MIRIQQPEQLRLLAAANIPIPLQHFISERLYQLEASGNLQRTGDQLLIVEASDDLVADYVHLGKAGLFSNTFDSNTFGDTDFASPLEFIGHHSDIAVCELLCQIDDESCIIIFVPHSVLQQHPELQNLILFLQQREYAVTGDASC